MHGQSAPVHGQAGPSWQDGADVLIPTSTVVRFLGRVESERKEIYLVTRHSSSSNLRPSPFVGEVHQRVNFSNEGTWLERIPQRELNGAWATVDVSNLTKIRVSHAEIRLLVGGDIKGIEEVTAKFDAMFAIDRKTFFN